MMLMEGHIKKMRQKFAKTMPCNAFLCYFANSDLLKSKDGKEVLLLISFQPSSALSGVQAFKQCFLRNGERRQN